MRLASAALQAFLEGPATVCVQFDLYTFQFIDGTQVRYSAGPSPPNFLWIPSAGFQVDSLLNAGGDRMFSVGPKFGRSKVTTQIGPKPTEVDIEIIVGANDLVGNVTFANAVRMGIFDGAIMELDRFFAPAPAPLTFGLDTSLGVIVWFYGKVSEVEIGRSKVSMKVKSILNIIAQQQMPRELYQASCSHVFGDVMCGVNREAFSATINAASGSTQSQIVVGFTPSPVNLYDNGSMVCLSGANVGQKRAISVIQSQIALQYKPWLYPVVIGDIFKLLPGCDHQLLTCQNTFGNLPNFGGAPYIPPPESAI